MNANEASQQVTYKVSRKTLVRDTRRDLQDCLDSVVTGLSLSSLANLYKEETENDLESIANVLGYLTVESMLCSNEFFDVAVREAEIVDGIVQEVYKSKVLASSNIGINSTTQFAESVADNNDVDSSLTRGRRAELLFGLSNERVMQGKERLITTIAKLGGEMNNIVLIDVQKQYFAEYGVLLDKAELRKYFPKSHIKQVFDAYMPNEVKVTADADRTGSLYVRLKKPFSEIKNEFKRINDDRIKANTKSNYKTDAEKALQDFIPINGTTAPVSEANDMYAPLRRLNQPTNGVSAFSSSQNNGALPTPSNVPSKFSLADSSVNEAYSFSDMNGLSKASMAPFVVKKDAKEAQPMVNGQQQITNSTTFSSNNTTNGQSDIDMFFENNAATANAPTTRFQRRNSVNLMELDLESAPKKPLSTEEILSSYNTNKKNNVNLNKNNVDEMITAMVNNFKAQLNTAKGNGEEIGVGNVEELQQILAESRNRAKNKYAQPAQNLINSQPTPSSIDQKKEEVKYTKRCDGEFTDDDETSSEDELEEGNRQVQIEEEMKNRANTATNDFFNDENDDCGDDAASVASLVSNSKRGPDVIPFGTDAIMSNTQRNGCHAEKYLRLAAIQQEENDARRMAHRIAQLQRYNPTASVEDLFANKSAKPNGHFNSQKEKPITNFEESTSTSTAPKNFFDNTFIDEDFAKSPVRVVKSGKSSEHLTDIFRSASALQLPKYAANGNDTQNEMFRLAANVCSIVMSRKPSITLNELVRALEGIYGRKIAPGKDFTESSWQLFFQNYCHNVSFIEMPSDLLLIWKTEMDSEFKEMMANVGKFCAQRALHF